MSYTLTPSASPPGPWPGYAPAYPAVVPAVRHTSHLKLVGLLALTLLLAAGAVVGVSIWLTPKRHIYVCPPNCGGPPTVKPVASRPHYTGPNGSYTVDYDPDGDISSAKTDSNGVTETLQVGDGGILRLFGVAAHGQTAQQVATGLVTKAFPSAKRSYVIPNAMVGFLAGYGEADNVNVQSSNGSYERDRLIVMVAVKGDVALVGEALGPYDEFSPSGVNDAHPTAADLEIAVFLLDPLLNTFRWHGDPPR